MFIVRVETHFSGAHFLNEYIGKCSDMHGHNWKVIVEVKGNELNKSGMLIDFKILKKIANEISNKFDHKVLNEIDYFNDKNPTAENIARYFSSELKKRLPEFEINLIQVFETDDYAATYIPDK